MAQGMCHCGLPLHYSDFAIEATIEELCAVCGEFVKVTVGGKSWKVPRHYIALHGLRGVDVASLGFEPWP